MPGEAARLVQVGAKRCDRSQRPRACSCTGRTARTDSHCACFGRPQGARTEGWRGDGRASTVGNLRDHRTEQVAGALCPEGVPGDALAGPPSVSTRHVLHDLHRHGALAQRCVDCGNRLVSLRVDPDPFGAAAVHGVVGTRLAAVRAGTHGVLNPLNLCGVACCVGVAHLPVVRVLDEVLFNAFALHHHRLKTRRQCGSTRRTRRDRVARKNGDAQVLSARRAKCLRNTVANASCALKRFLGLAEIGCGVESPSASRLGGDVHCVSPTACSLGALYVQGTRPRREPDEDARSSSIARSKED